MFMNEKTPMTNEQTNALILGSIKKQQRGLKLLTGTALGLWLVSTMGIVFLIWAYFFTYLPKEREIIYRLDREVNASSASASPSGESEKARTGQKQEMFIMTRVVGIGIVSTAACVAVLSAGMFATIMLVIWNRRVTLRQINANLTQISAQLKELQSRESEKAAKQ
jgi:hypothetical protein